MLILTRNSDSLACTERRRSSERERRRLAPQATTWQSRATSSLGSKRLLKRCQHMRSEPMTTPALARRDLADPSRVKHRPVHCALTIAFVATRSCPSPESHDRVPSKAIAPA
jgi:hypothetical protein